ncbi:MAG: helix-turn-helix transcriptional regulator [Actinomycetota bacterium]|nr:MAG: helix-turn-helix transcriptional regulator [Actinomycetota bacterium]
MKAATMLFYRDGIAVTGVDRIAAEAGVGKMSLYRHFDGKDDLVVEVLRRAGRRASRLVVADDAPGEAQVLAVFDRIAGAARKPGFRGVRSFGRRWSCRWAIRVGRSCWTTDVSLQSGPTTTFKLPVWSTCAGTVGRLVMLIDGAVTACAVQRSAARSPGPRSRRGRVR